jgi:hypothetical protein
LDGTPAKLFQTTYHEKWGCVTGGQRFGGENKKSEAGRPKSPDFDVFKTKEGPSAKP